MSLVPTGNIFRRTSIEVPFKLGERPLKHHVEICVNTPLESSAQGASPDERVINVTDVENNLTEAIAQALASFADEVRDIPLVPSADDGKETS